MVAESLPVQTQPGAGIYAVAVQESGLMWTLWSILDRNGAYEAFPFSFSPLFINFLFIFILLGEKLLPVPRQLLEHSSTNWDFIAFMLSCS